MNKETWGNFLMYLGAIMISFSLISLINSKLIKLIIGVILIIIYVFLKVRKK